MCGLAGHVGRDVDHKVLEHMIGTLRHRGPDDVGVWVSPDRRYGLAHARLSIIDCSSAGHQPMSYADGRLWAAFNGEVYNFQELRAELATRGHRFTSRSDTEVVLAAYVEWGVECFSRMVGMFAVAMVDLTPPPGAPEVVLVRDRLGIKPLLYAHTSDGLWFASELRAFRRGGVVPLSISDESLRDFLAVGAVFQPRTIFSQVSCVAPGTRLELRGRDVRHVTYWDLHDATADLRRQLRSISDGEAIDGIRDRLKEATRYHLVADVPVGAFLSGGIDSSGVVALMSEVSGAPVKTVAVGFADHGHVADERADAEFFARTIGADHAEVVITDADAAQTFPDYVRALDQPSIDGINTYFVSRHARQSVTVALSGLGGDEIFAGYPHFQWLAADHGKPRYAAPLERRALELAMRLRPNSPSLRRLFRLAGPAGRLSMLRRILGDHQLSSALNARFSARFRERLEAQQDEYLRADADEVQQTSYAEVRGYLASTLLRDADVMSMAHGLEVRPVLLHHPLVEFAYALPAHLKLRGGIAKYVFRSAIRDRLPTRTLEGRKRGFEMPFTSWMRDGLRSRFEALLHTRNASALFSKAYLTRLRTGLARGRPERTLWAWGVLLDWFQLEGVEV